MTGNHIFSIYLCTMKDETTKNSTIDIAIPALTYGTLAIQAAKAGIDISTLLTREALSRQGRNASLVAALPPVPAPMPAAGAAGVPRPVVVSGADPDLSLG